MDKIGHTYNEPFDASFFDYLTFTKTTYFVISFICSVRGKDASFLLEGKSIDLGKMSIKFNTALKPI